MNGGPISLLLRAKTCSVGLDFRVEVSDGRSYQTLLTKGQFGLFIETECISSIKTMIFHELLHAVVLGMFGHLELEKPNTNGVFPLLTGIQEFMVDALTFCIFDRLSFVSGSYEFGLDNTKIIFAKTIFYLSLIDRFEQDYFEYLRIRLEKSTEEILPNLIDQDLELNFCQSLNIRTTPIVFYSSSKKEKALKFITEQISCLERNQFPLEVATSQKVMKKLTNWFAAREFYQFLK
ncbi:MAG: hypothetical protein ACRCXZ_00965 [Patescibacteria group bacterium]